MRRLDTRHGYTSGASDPRQNLVAEPLHRGQHLVRARSAETKVDMAHPKCAKRAKIARELSRAAGKQTALSVIRSWCEITAVFRATEGKRYRRGVASGLGDQPVQPCDRRLVARQAVERMCGVDADRIPTVAEPGRAAERRPAFAAHPDRWMRRLHRLGCE